MKFIKGTPIEVQKAIEEIEKPKRKTLQEMYAEGEYKHYAESDEKEGMNEKLK